MKEDGLKIIECKSSERLMELWNIWMDRTCFMSVGNCQTPEWYDLVEYGKNNQEEAAKFVIEYIADIESNWSILTFCDDAIFCPIDKDAHPGYISPKSVGQLYVTSMELFLNENTYLKDGKLYYDYNKVNVQH